MDNGNTENVSNTPTHKWRCINCGEMAHSDICSNCGKESYYKTDSAKREFPEKEKTASPAAEKRHPSEIEYVNDDNRELKTVTMSVNSLCDDTNKMKKKITAFMTTGVLIGIVLAFLNFQTGSKIDELKKENNELKDEITSLSSKSSQPQKTQAPAEISENKDDANSDETIKYKFHIVKAGENLQTICNDYNVDYEAYKNIIISLNGIENPSVINVGQAIMLPILN